MPKSSRHLGRTTAALTALAAAGMLAAAPSTAVPAARPGGEGPSVRVLDDQAGDVWRMDWEDNQEVYRVARRQQVGDIARARITHRRAVTVRVRFTELDRVGHGWRHEVGYRTPDDRFAASVVVQRGRWKGQLILGNGRAPVHCPRATQALDYAENRLTLRIPSRCLGHPQWVRLQIESSWERDGHFPAFSDNPHNTGIEPYGFSRRVWRG